MDSIFCCFETYQSWLAQGLVGTCNVNDMEMFLSIAYNWQLSSISWEVSPGIFHCRPVNTCLVCQNASRPSPVWNLSVLELYVVLSLPRNPCSVLVSHQFANWRSRVWIIPPPPNMHRNVDPTLLQGKLPALNIEHWVVNGSVAVAAGSHDDEISIHRDTGDTSLQK